MENPSVFSLTLVQEAIWDVAEHTARDEAELIPGHPVERYF
jgi:hypothetical protein